MLAAKSQGTILRQKWQNFGKVYPYPRKELRKVKEFGGIKYS